MILRQFRLLTNLSKRQQHLLQLALPESNVRIHYTSADAPENYDHSSAGRYAPPSPSSHTPQSSPFYRIQKTHFPLLLLLLRKGLGWKEGDVLLTVGIELNVLRMTLLWWRTHPALIVNPHPYACLTS